jgi:hypothetical protein
MNCIKDWYRKLVEEGCKWNKGLSGAILMLWRELDGQEKLSYAVLGRPFSESVENYRCRK